jgi:hypothetical protein
MAEKRVVGTFDDVDQAEAAAEAAPGDAAVDAEVDSDAAFARDRGDSAETPPDTTVAFEVDSEGEAEVIADDLKQEGAESIDVDPADQAGPSNDGENYPRPDEP